MEAWKKHANPTPPMCDDEWQFVVPSLTLMRLDAPQREHDLRDMFDALRWMARAGAGWRLLPHNFPPWEVRLRTAAYLATLSAVRYNPMLRAFYERLRAANKPVKVARCVAARKLLHLA